MVAEKIETGQTNSIGLPIPAKIKILMINRGITPMDVARALGYARGYVYQLFCGSIVSKPARKKVEQYFGVPIWSEGTEADATSQKNQTTT